MIVMINAYNAIKATDDPCLALFAWVLLAICVIGLIVALIAIWKEEKQ